MPSCEYCGCKVSQRCAEEMPDGSIVFVCGKEDCDEVFLEYVEDQNKSMEWEPDKGV